LIETGLNVFVQVATSDSQSFVRLIYVTLSILFSTNTCCPLRISGNIDGAVQGRRQRKDCSACFPISRIVSRTKLQAWFNVMRAPAPQVKSINDDVTFKCETECETLRTCFFHLHDKEALAT